MNDYSGFYQKAQEQYHIADHLLQVTYPLMKDPKLLMGICTNIFNSLEQCSTAILSYEYQEGMIKVLPSNLNQKVSMLRTFSPSKNKIPLPLLTLTLDLAALKELHNKSPVEFSRNS